MAMRQNYWNDSASSSVQQEKQFFQKILSEHGIYPKANLDDAKYFFFSLPSIIIVKGYALGFLDQTVKLMMSEFIEANKSALIQREQMKIQYRM
ncbi:hypothetical protein L289_2785 [Acinetobacter gerneri DSM 14967 = CIP 107464 = MTCC 9824]|jgi:hypothetical protein|nr:hypothetical protein L289_2785 [Acinetobacter gerneri DSM 14967 = CIP 107464 = MTCC 9824]